MWRDASKPLLLSDNPAMHGWLPDMSIEWIEEPYPSDITELLFNTGDDSEVDEGQVDYELSSSSEEDSDFEEDDF